MIKDDINPSHYKNGKIEAIDAIESAVVGKPGPEAVQVGNIIKYLWRYEDKNGLVDVKKCRWYLERLISILEEKEKSSVASFNEQRFKTTDIDNLWSKL